MSTSADVREAWESHVLQSATVQAFTDKAFPHDISDQDAQFDLADLYSSADGEGPRINFLLCIVRRRLEPRMVGSTRYTFEVRLEYYLQETDQPGTTFNTHTDRLDAVDALVLAALGVDWDGTVDFYEGGVPLQTQLVTIDERQCWRGGYTYRAFKTA